MQSDAISGHQQRTFEQAHDAQDTSDAYDPQHHRREGQHDVRCELVEQRGGHEEEVETVPIVLRQSEAIRGN